LFAFLAAYKIVGDGLDFWVFFVQILLDKKSFWFVDNLFKHRLRGSAVVKTMARQVYTDFLLATEGGRQRTAGSVQRSVWPARGGGSRDPGHVTNDP